MLRDFYKYMCVSLAALLAAACADLPETTEVPDPQEPRYMTFDISEIDTKVSDSDITSYEFSIWIFDPDAEETLVDGDNVKLRYDSASGRWRFHDGSSFKDVEWGNGNHDFFVVSSYDLAGTSEKISFDKSGMGYMSSYQNNMAMFKIPTMNMTYSSGGSDYNYYKDILYAAASRNVTEEDGYKPVSLTLRHLWPALEFNMINQTGQDKYITDFSVSNFDVAFQGFSFYVNRGYELQLDNYTGVADNKYEVEDFVLRDGEQRSVFGMPVMVFPQKFVSNENSAILSFSVDGVKTTKSFFVDAPDGLSTQAWNSGTLYSYDIRLKTAAEPVVISPSASVEHVKDASGVLTHSALTLNLNLVDAQLSRVKDLTVVVSKDGVEYLNQTFATVSSNQMTLYKGSASDPGRFYMPQVPQGEDGYQVTLTYNDGFYDQEVTCSATSPAPDYTLTVNVSATSNQFTVNSMSVNIADRVLAECPLKGHSTDYIFWVRGNTGQKFIYTSDVGEPLTSSNIVSNVTFSNFAPQTYGYYTIYPYVKFDDVVKEAANFNIVTSNKYEEQYKQNIYPDVKKYKKSDQLSSATELQDGKMYILEASRVHRGYYWRVGSDGQLEFSSALSTDDIPENYIFMYKVDNTKSVSMEDGYYNYSPVGAWYSVSKEKYMNEGDYPPYFNSSSPVRYVKCGTGWKPSPGNEFDISKGYNAGVPELLRYSSSTSSGVYWGTNGVPNDKQYWKWYIYEVVYE